MQWLCETDLCNDACTVGDASCACQAKTKSVPSSSVALFIFPSCFDLSMNLMLEMIFQENLNNIYFPFESCISFSVHVYHLECELILRKESPRGKVLSRLAIR